MHLCTLLLGNLQVAVQWHEWLGADLAHGAIQLKVPMCVTDTGPLAHGKGTMHLCTSAVPLLAFG